MKIEPKEYEEMVSARVPSHIKSSLLQIMSVCCSLSDPACNANEPRHNVVCSLCGSTTLFHIIS